MESVGLTLWGTVDLTKDRGQWRSLIRTHSRQMAGVGTDDDDDDDDVKQHSQTHSTI